MLPCSPAHTWREAKWFAMLAPPQLYSHLCPVRKVKTLLTSCQEKTEAAVMSKSSSQACAHESLFSPLPLAEIAVSCCFLLTQLIRTCCPLPTAWEMPEIHLDVQLSPALEVVSWLVFWGGFGLLFLFFFFVVTHLIEFSGGSSTSFLVHRRWITQVKLKELDVLEREPQSTYCTVKLANFSLINSASWLDSSSSQPQEIPRRLGSVITK